MDPPRAVGAGGAVHAHPAHRAPRQRAVQVLRRLDRPRRQGRAAAQHATPPAGRRAQHRRDHVGVGRPEEVSPRPDRLRPALSRPSMPTARSTARPSTPPTTTRSSIPGRTRSRPSGLRCATPTRRRRSGPGTPRSPSPMAPSPYWGDEKIWDTKANNHNGMIDRKGRVWFAATVRGPRNPDFCKKGSDHPSAKLFPLEQTNRHITMLDPKTMKYTFVDTCFQTHHLQFGYDANDTLWTSGGGPVVGWVNTKLFDETGDAARSQGWTAFVLDTNGNGKRDDYVEPDQPVDPTKDKRIAGGFYAVMPSPVDGSVWGSVGVVRRHGGDRAGRAGPESAGDRARGDLQRAEAVFRHPRRRHRQAGRRVGVARQRPPRQLRPAQVQGAAQRAEGHRRSLPRGLGLLPVPWPRIPGHRREQRGVELLHLGRPAQHVRTRRGRADVDGQPQRRPGRAQGRQDDRAARPLSARLLRQGLRRAHRRSRTPAGRAEGCGRPAATGRRGSRRAARARSLSSCTSSSAPIRSRTDRSDRRTAQPSPARRACWRDGARGGCASRPTGGAVRRARRGRPAAPPAQSGRCRWRTDR